MAEAYNWAKMSTRVQGFNDNKTLTDTELAGLKNLYKSIWTACLGSDDIKQKLIDDNKLEEANKIVTFDEFYQATLNAPPSKVNGDSFMKKLKEQFAIRCPGEKFTGATFKTKINDFLKEQANLGDNNPNKIVDRKIGLAMRMVASQYNRTGNNIDQMHSSDTHIAAGYLMGIGKHLQQGCGQGKSSAVATATLMNRGVEGAQKQMFVTSSTAALAAQSFKDIAAYFDDLGIGQHKVIDGKVQGTERVFLMTADGPRVAVRNQNGHMLTQNNDPTEKYYNRKDGKLEIAKRDKNTESGWEEGSIPYEDLTPEEKKEAFNLAGNDYQKGFDENASSKTEIAHFKIDGNGKVVGLAERVVGKEPPNNLEWEQGENIKPFDKLNDTQKKEALQIIYGEKENIIIADNATVVQDNMKGVIPDLGKDEGGQPQRHVIMDEGDFVKNDQYQYLQQTGDEYSFAEQEHRNTCRISARKIVESIAKDKSLYDCNIQTQFVQLNSAGIQAVVDKCKEAKIELTNEMMFFIEEALIAEVVYLPNVDYVVENGKVISQHRASGAQIDLPEGVAQALAVKAGVEIPSEKRVFNIQTITGAYSDLFGRQQTRASGTHEAETLSDAVVVANRKVAGKPDPTKVQTAQRYGQDKVVSALMQNTRYRTMLDDNDQVDRAILAETKIILNDGRPVLIGCVTSEDVAKMKEQLRGQYPPEPGKKPGPSGTVEKWGDKTVITYTAESAAQYEEDLANLTDEQFQQKYHLKTPKKDAPATLDEYVKKFGGKKNTIVLGTSIVGRGANIKINDEMNEKGGLHVITRGLHPSSVRQMIQFINRSMRGSDNGSSHEYFSVKDLENARPQIEARKKEVLELIDKDKKLPQLTPEKRKELEIELAELDGALGLIEKGKSKKAAKTQKKVNRENYRAKDILAMLQDDGCTVRVDNDGNQIDKDGNVVRVGVDSEGKAVSTVNGQVIEGDVNAAEAAYRGFYGVGDARNSALANKARGIEIAVSQSIDKLKEHISKMPCKVESKRFDIALTVVPEFVGRALQLQNRVNGNTSEAVAEACKDQVTFLYAMYTTKANQIAQGNEFNEKDYLDKVRASSSRFKEAAESIFHLSEIEAAEFRANNREHGEGLAVKLAGGEEEATKIVVQKLSKEELKEAYALINGVEQGTSIADLEIDTKSLIEAIKNNKVSFSKVLETVRKIQAAQALQAEQNKTAEAAVEAGATK